MTVVTQELRCRGVCLLVGDASRRTMPRRALCRRLPRDKKEPAMADAIRTAPREDRVLCGPALTFAITEEMSLLEREPEWISGIRNSVTVVREIK